jgi:NAD(P)-dependent dehydrogenase (short-subunit alcohol dehydrogenase family)
MKDPYRASNSNILFCIFTGLWGIVNNAGWSTFGHVEWVPIPICRKSLEVNVWGMMRVIRAFLPLIRQSKGMYLITTIIHKKSLKEEYIFQTVNNIKASLACLADCLFWSSE